MIKDDYLPMIRNFRLRVECDFPNEEIDIADKMIIEKIVREQTDRFRENNSQRRILLTNALIQSVYLEMKQYGFKSRRIEFY